MSRSSAELTRGARGASGLVTSCPRHNLACPPNRLIGREEELSVAVQLLLARDSRLVTVSGVAGVGKTRLALAAAAQVATTVAEGAWFVDLAPVRDPGEVLAVVSRTVGLPVDGRRSPLDLLSGRFAARAVLLVLDNFEQVLPAAEHVASLLSACPGVKVLATSRSRLQIRWERVVSLRPLPYGAPDEPQSAEAAASIPAVALFVERAQASQASFVLTDENVSSVLALSAWLEGLPLAIELAAAHANVMTPEEMLDRMEQHLPALSWAARDLPARQRTLHDALHWSYELLSPTEQVLFRSLAVFVGGCTLAAAEAVAPVPTPGLEVAAGLTALVDASLAQVSHEDGRARFGMLETVREFACHHLAASGELDEARGRHADFFLTEVELASNQRSAAARSTAYARLTRDGDNLLAALKWSACNPGRDGAVRLAPDLARIWRAPMHLREGRDWVARLLERALDAPPAHRLAGMRALGELTTRLGELDRAVEWLDQSLDLARQLGDLAAQAETIGALARVAALQGRADRLPELGGALATVGAAIDPWHLSFALHGLAQLAYQGGANRTAAHHVDAALDLLDRGDSSAGIDHLVATRALIAHAEGDAVRAPDLAARSLQHPEMLGARGAVWCAYVAFVVAGGWTAPELQVRLLAGIDGQRARLSFLLSPRMHALAEEAMPAARTSLDNDAVDPLRREGRAMGRAELVTAAQSALRACPGVGCSLPPPMPRRRIGVLSPRERQVLELMAEGLTNRQIAERLFVSVATVNFHVGWVLRKIGAENRTQAVILGAKQGLLGAPADSAAVVSPTREPTRSERPPPFVRNQQSR